MMKRVSLNFNQHTGEESGGGVGNNQAREATKAEGRLKNLDEAAEKKVQPHGAGNAGNAANAGGLGGGESGGTEGSHLTGDFEGQGPPKAKSE